MMTTNNLNSRWDSLGFDPLRTVFQLYDADHPLNFYIGKDTGNQRLLLLVTPEIPPSIRDMREIRIRSFRRDDGQWSILFNLENATLEPMFSLVCNDLIEFSRDIKKPSDKLLGLILKRLSNWRRLLEKGASNTLGENEIRGLFGELLFLKILLLSHNKIEAVKAWRGPMKADQDFQFPDMAWEIKTLWPGANSILIASESQLHRIGRPICLVVFELAEGKRDESNVMTLNLLVNNIDNELADDHDATELFRERLISACYIPNAEYDSYTYVENSMQIYSVENAFPCITPDTLAMGISNVGYEVNLSACENFRVNSEIIKKHKDC